MSDFDRAFMLMDRIDERAAARTIPSRFGTTIVHERLHRVHDLNFLRVEQPAGASAQELADEAERLQPSRLLHRRVNVRVEDEALEEGFRRLGWERNRFVLMVHRRAPDRDADLSLVRETDAESLRPIWAAGIRSAPFGRDEEVVQQLLEHKGAISGAIPTRYFAAEVDGELVSFCELYSEDGVGQVEAVLTLPSHRGRGLARAVVLRALDASREAGNDLTFLVADADDWPQRLYEKLGFETVGRYARFLKQHPNENRPTRSQPSG
jgi:ribosomal protein S18 acetylase RimI-like enzyme